MTTIYQYQTVESCQKFYGELLQAKNFENVAEHLAALAEKMHEGIVNGESCVLSEFNNYHPSYLGQSASELKKLSLNLKDCQLCIAQEYGFTDWHEVVKQTQPYHHDFEEAVNHLIFGRKKELEDLLKQFPPLISTTSQYGHEATLLHYVASNGVEMWRQQVPNNLADITRLLLENGADKNAKMKVYGGEFDTLSLLMTSAHPKAAGVTPEMELILKN